MLSKNKSYKIRRMKKYLLPILLTINILNLYSQELVSKDYKQNEIKYDTLKILDLSQKLNIYTGLSGKIHSIEMDNSVLHKTLKLEPNGKTSIDLGFSYKWIGLGVSFTPKFLNSDNEIYGNSERFDTQFNIYMRKLGIDAYLQYYKGFYLKNPDDFISWPNEYFPLRPDLESFSFGLSGYYFFNNKNFSYKAAYTRTQIQKKSAGSLVLGLYLSFNTASALGGFIPQELPDSLINYYNIDGYLTSSLVGSIGYTYTLVFLKRFFINLSVVPGLGFRNAEYWSDGVNTKQEAVPTVSLTARGALGYEGKNIYAGLSLVSFVDSYETESLSIASSTGNLKLFVGTRLGVKPLLKKNQI